MASGLQLPFIDVDCEAVSLDLQLINKIEEMRPDTLTSSDASLCREHRMNLENIRARQEADKLRKKLRREFLVHSYGGSSLTHPESKKLRKYLIDVLHNEELTASHKVAQLKSLVPCVRAIALLICDLDEVASQLDPNVSDSLLREQTSYLNTVFEKMFEMSSLPSDDCVLGMEYILSSWQAMYMYAIRIVQRVHNFCRDPREQRGSPTGVLNSQSQDLTLRMLQSLPLPTELSFSSKTKTWLEHCFEAFRLSCKCLTVYSPTLESMANGFHSVMPIARGDPDFEKYVKKSRECLKLKLGNSVNLGQRLAVTSREGSAVCTAAAIWWKIGGNALRSHSEHMQKAYFEYITQSVGNFKAFADFLDVAVELEGEISTEVENTQTIAHIYDVVNVSGPFLQLMGTEYESLEEFSVQLERLKVFIEFMMAMPAISQDMALDTYSGLMQKEDQVTGGFSHKKHRLLKQAQVKYKSTYDQLVASYLPDSGTKGSAKPLILALEALAKSDCFRQPVQQWELQKVREQIPKLLAHLGFLFSLVQSHLINEQLETHAETVATMQAVNPHCIQVLGILGMLNIGEAHGNISNHIARVLTGQGKSWYAALQMLLLLASLFTCTGKDTYILCHNPDLVERDRINASQFSDLIKSNVDGCGEVRYLTFREMCEVSAFSVERNGAQWTMDDLVRKIWTKSGNTRGLALKGASPNAVLLLDEADVLFGDCFDSVHSSVCVLADEAYAKIQEQMWRQKRKPEMPEILEIVKHLNPDAHTSEWFEKEVDRMYQSYEDIQNERYSLEFRLSNDQRAIETKTKNDAGGVMWSSRWYFTYLNAFAYLREKEKVSGPDSTLEVGTETYGYILLPGCEMSFASVPGQFGSIFGVTGSLEGLTKVEKMRVLREKYNVGKFSYLPSFWGARQLEWDAQHLTHGQFAVLNSEDEVFRKAVLVVRQMVLEERSVLVFFQDSETLNRFRR
ncbi:MAG: hypothetical protein SGPRY_000802, partial [Prymnesium sp.]